MSNIVTFEQAQRIKRLVFSWKTTAYYVDGSLDYNNPINWNTNEGLDENGEYQEEDEYCSAPTVSEALDWVREEKRVICAVDVDYFDGWYYTGKYQDMTKTDFQYTDSFDDHHLASSALLDAVLTYLEQKENP